MHHSVHPCALVLTLRYIHTLSCSQPSVAPYCPQKSFSSSTCGSGPAHFLQVNLMFQPCKIICQNTQDLSHFGPLPKLFSLPVRSPFLQAPVPIPTPLPKFYFAKQSLVPSRDSPNPGPSLCSTKLYPTIPQPRSLPLPLSGAQLGNEVVRMNQ